MVKLLKRIQMSSLLKLVFVFVLINKTYAQLDININHSVSFLVEKILVGKNSNISVSNISYSGSPLSIAYFYNEGTNLVMKEGIMLSTGYAVDAQGPNNSTRTGETVNFLTNAELGKIGNGKTGDVAILEFDFMPFTDSIIFNYVFASEEYPEYVDKNVNDVFAFFINEKGSSEKTNLAVIEDEYGDIIPITINNINSVTNNDYYINNDRRNLGLFRTFQYDGFTKLLVAKTKVKPFHKYHISIEICDIGDRYFDSAVFLKKQSFKSKGKVILSNQEELNLLLKNSFSAKYITESSNKVRLKYNIKFDFDDSKITDIKSYNYLDEIVKFMQNNPNVNLSIYGYTDNIGKQSYNMQLSKERAKSVYHYLISQNIEEHRLSYFGKGSDNLIENKANKKKDSRNRRVEFSFSL